MSLRAIGGFLLWLGFLAIRPQGTGQSEIVLILVLGLFVVLPLGIDLTYPKDSPVSNMFAAARYLQPFAAVVAASSFLLPPGILAGTLAIAWLPLTGLLAVDALLRIRARGLGPLEELAVDTGALYLPVGAFWLWASRMGLEPFGFTEPIVLLTAVHFHFAGFAGPVMAGLVGRRLRSAESGPSPLYGLAALLVVIGPAVVAAGFFLPGAVEALAATALAAGYFGLAFFILFGVIRSVPGLPVRLLLAVSAVSIVLAMAAAVLFAAGNASRMVVVPIETMVQVHGWLNAVGFAVVGLVGWSLVGDE